MITRIRDVRQAKGLTLADVAARCVPATTAQTIGRLETGTRTVSVGWLNRIAAALGVDASELVDMPAASSARIDIAATIDHLGAHALEAPAHSPAPTPGPGQVAVTVATSVGEYRSGDVIWCNRVAPRDFADMLNRDVLLPRPGGRFVFGRLIGRDGGKLLVLPPEAGSKQQVVADPPWAAMAITIVRAL